MSEKPYLHPRSVLVAVLAISMLPLVLAAALNVFAPQWRPWGTANNGELIEPPRLLSVHGLQGLDDQPPGADLLSHGWTMVYLGTPSCADACRAQLDKLGRVILALGKDAPRVQRLLVLAPGGTGTPRVTALEQTRPRTRVVRAAARWMDAFGDDGNGTSAPGRLYVVDPRGYLMMRYAPATEAAKILADMKRLLKASRIG